MNHRVYHRLVLAAVTALTCASAAATPARAESTNACAATGLSASAAAKALGTSVRVASSYQGGTQGVCTITPTDSTHHAAVQIALILPGKVPGMTEQDMYQGNAESRVVHGLGTGAALLVYRTGYVGTYILFKAGPHGVWVKSEAPNDNPKLLNATESNAVAVAHAIYDHLH